METQQKMENTNIFNFETISENYGKMIKSVRAGNSCSIFGVQNSMRPALVSNFGKKVLYLTADNVRASSVTEQFKFMGLNTFVLPNIPDVFLYKKAGSTELYRERSKTLYQILNNDCDVIVAPIESLIYYFPNVNSFKNHILNL